MHLYCVKGDFIHAIRLLERGFTRARDLNNPFWLGYLTWSLGQAYVRTGRVGEGLPLLQEAAESPGLRAFHPLVCAHLAEAYLLVDRPADAFSLAEEALALSRDQNQRGMEAWALLVLGEVASHRDPPDLGKAEDHYEQAMALANEFGMRPLVAHCHLGLGKLYRRVGKRQDAQKHLTTATTM